MRSTYMTLRFYTYLKENFLNETKRLKKYEKIS